jgi:peptidoglycan/xylan/chitin deacetylase (PgdA/CDA1 family)
MNNITKLDEKLQKDFNYKPFVIRFPGGSSNTISRKYSEGIMTKLVKKVSDAGYDYLDWNVDSEDATGNNVAKKKLIANVTGGLQENRDNVVLMHDTNAKMTTAKSLKKIIKYAKANGFEFYAFTEGTPAVHHGTNN